MRTTGKLLILAVVVSAIALIVSACGGSSGNSTVSSTTAGGTKISQGGSPDQGPQTGGANNPKFPVSNPDKAPRQKQASPPAQGKKIDSTTSKKNTGTGHSPSKNHFDSNRSGHGSTPAPPSKTPPVAPVGAPQVHLTPDQQQSKALRAQQQGMDRCLAQAADQLGLGAQWKAGTLKSDQMLNINVKAQKCIAKSAKNAMTSNVTPPKPPHVQAMKITKPGQVNKPQHSK